MRKWIGSLLMLMAVVACRHTAPEYNLQKGSRYTLIDSTNKTDSFKVYDSHDRFAWYPIFYLGDPQSVYTLGRNPIPGRISQQLDTTLKTARWTNELMSIYVDTTMDIAHEGVYDHEYRKDGLPTLAKGEYIVDSVKHFKAYAVFITNRGDSTLYFGDFNYVNFMYREAKNERGEWVPIETLERGDQCGVSGRKIFLPPNKVMIAKVLRYKGDYKATCRLRFGNRKATVYSNTYTDYIDKRMLTERLPSR